MIRLIRIRLLACTAAAMLLLAPAHAQAFMEHIEHAMKTGDANELAAYFGASVGITINNSEATYYPKQGLQVMRDYFRRNQVRDFSFRHVGNQSTAGGFYAIGAISTKTGQSKVYLYFRQEQDRQHHLVQIRIEK